MGAHTAFDPVLEADERFTLHAPEEIVALLRSLAKQNAMITVYFGQDSEFILTSILAVNPDFHELVLDLGADTRANKLLLQAARLKVVAYEGHIKVQFSASHAQATMHEGRSAFRMRIPGAVVRLQRREFYRARLPMGNPIKGYLQPFAERPGELHEVRLADISCGGIAMILAAADIPIQVGQVYPACSINLPGVGTVSAAVEITYMIDAVLRNGTTQRSAGCRFIKLPGPMQSMIQRYINKVERERHLMRR